MKTKELLFVALLSAAMALFGCLGGAPAGGQAGPSPTLSEAEVIASGEIADINSVSADIGATDALVSGADVELNVSDIQ